MKKHPNYDDIPAKAEVWVFYEDGTRGNHGIVTGADLHYLLRGYTLDKEAGLWFSDKGYKWAYEVKVIE